MKYPLKGDIVRLRTRIDDTWIRGLDSIVTHISGSSCVLQHPYVESAGFRLDWPDERFELMPTSPAEWNSAEKTQQDTREHTGGSVSYYTIKLANGVEVQCNEIIKALGMTYAEGNVFKAVWRTTAARQGKSKRGYDDALYDAEKVVFFGNDMIEAAKEVKA